MRRFPMSLDAAHRRITTVVIGLCAAVLGIQVAVCRPPVAWIPLLTAALLAPIMGSCWAVAPTALSIDGRMLRIERRGWRPLDIPLDDIARTDGVPSLRPFGAVRLFGVGGFFGTFGLMWSRSIGRFRAYVTRSAPSLLRRRRSALPVLVTPDDRDAVVAALRAAGVPDVP